MEILFPTCFGTRVFTLAGIAAAWESVRIYFASVLPLETTEGKMQPPGILVATRVCAVTHLKWSWVTKPYHGYTGTMETGVALEFACLRRHEMNSGSFTFSSVAAVRLVGVLLGF